MDNPLDKFSRFRDGEPNVVPCNEDSCEIAVCPSCGRVTRIIYSYHNGKVTVKRFNVTEQEFNDNVGKL